MKDDRPTNKELADLTKQIRKDQIKVSPAEKRVRIKSSFENAIKKMGRTPPPKKKAD